MNKLLQSLGIEPQYQESFMRLFELAVDRGVINIGNGRISRNDLLHAHDRETLENAMMEKLASCVLKRGFLDLMRDEPHIFLKNIEGELSIHRPVYDTLPPPVEETPKWRLINGRDRQRFSIPSRQQPALHISGYGDLPDANDENSYALRLAREAWQNRGQGGDDDDSPGGGRAA